MSVNKLTVPLNSEPTLHKYPAEEVHDFSLFPQITIRCTSVLATSSSAVEVSACSQIPRPTLDSTSNMNMVATDCFQGVDSTSQLNQNVQDTQANS